MEPEIYEKRTEETHLRKTQDPYSPEKLFGVAILGAVTGLFAYYLYYHLSDETKKVVKDAVMTGVKAQMVKLAVAD